MKSKPVMLSLSAAIIAACAMTAFGEGATIKGKVTYKGTPPKTTGPKIKNMQGADPVCAALHPDGARKELIVVDAAGGLRDVFVYVKSGLPNKKWDVPKEQVVLDQKGCMYSPPVFGVMAGQEILIKNSDGTAHNIHALPKNSAEFNKAQPRKGMEMVQSFKTAEMSVKIKCDVHPWMGAWAHVMDHPFHATTSTDGTFEITGLPAGEYVIEAWTDKMGTQTMTVKVGDGETNGDVAFEFERKRKKKG